MRQSQTSNLSRYSGTSFPLFGSECGGLSASAYSKNSRLSNSHYFRSRSISPVNGYRPSHNNSQYPNYLAQGHRTSNQFQSTSQQKAQAQKAAPADSLGDLSSSQNLQSRQEIPFYKSNAGWQTHQNQSQRGGNEQVQFNKTSTNSLNKHKSRMNKHHSRTMGPSTPVQELVTPLPLQKLSIAQKQPHHSRNELSSQRGYHLESS